MFNKITNFFKEIDEEYQREQEEMERKEQEWRELREKNRVNFKDLALNDDEAERLFNVASYFRYLLDPESKKQINNDWKEYYEAAKESKIPILPYYKYVIQRMEVKLKPFTE